MRCCTIDSAPFSVSGCPGWVPVVGNVGLEVLTHLNYVYYVRKRAVHCEGRGCEVGVYIC